MNTRAVVGLLIAALFPAVVGALLSPITEGRLLSALGLMPIFFFFSSIATAVLGIPAFVLLNHFGLIRWWSAALSGLAIGTIVAVVVSLPNAVQLQAVLVMAPMGAVAALLFWVIWRPRHAA